MTTRCPTCDRVYDDAQLSTTCPHDIGVAGGRLCRKHDLFDCHCQRASASPRDRMARPRRDR